MLLRAYSINTNQPTNGISLGPVVHNSE